LCVLWILLTSMTVPMQVCVATPLFHEMYYRHTLNICERDSSWQCMCDDIQHFPQYVVQA